MLPAPSNHFADVDRIGQLHTLMSSSSSRFENAARTRVARYRNAYDNRSGTTDAFLPCVMSTSVRIHGEFPGSRHSGAALGRTGQGRASWTTAIILESFIDRNCRLDLASFFQRLHY